MRDARGGDTDEKGNGVTTPAAANFYLAKHLLECDGIPNAIWNPHNKPVETLPVIFGFNNGGSEGWYHAVALAEDGTALGEHICSHEGYMRHDLGIIDGTRRDRHEESYKKHYPDGYRMAFIAYAEVRECKELLAAIENSKRLPQT